MTPHPSLRPTDLSDLISVGALGAAIKVLDQVLSAEAIDSAISTGALASALDGV